MRKPLFTIDGLPIAGSLNGMLVVVCESVGSRRGIWYQTSFYTIDEDQYDQICRERAFVGLETM